MRWQSLRVEMQFMGVFTGMYAFLYWVASEGRHDDSQHNLSCCANRFFIMVLFLKYTLHNKQKIERQLGRLLEIGTIFQYSLPVELSCFYCAVKLR